MHILATILIITGAFSAAVFAQDSSHVKSLEHDIALAELRVQATSFWSRIRPSIHFSASFGMKDAIVYDPANTLLPRDSYRLTMSVPLHEIFRTEQHDEAAIRLRGLREDLVKARKEYALKLEQKQRRAEAMAGELQILKAELHLLREIVRYDELLYQDGSLTFDALARARLQVLQAERQILQIDSEIAKVN
jgi:outer membrane protein TolC